MPDARRYEVIWADTAAEDLDALVQLIALDSPVNALKIWDRLRKRVETLNRYPGRCRVVPELKVIGLDLYRELILEPWRILYRIKDRKVFVLGIFDGRRDLEDILLERLTRQPLS